MRKGKTRTQRGKGTRRTRVVARRSRKAKERVRRWMRRWMAGAFFIEEC